MLNTLNLIKNYNKSTHLSRITIKTNIILPILLGYFLKNRGFFSQIFLNEGNKLVFKVLLPVLLFSNLYLSELNLSITTRDLFESFTPIKTPFSSHNSFEIKGYVPTIPEVKTFLL